MSFVVVVLAQVAEVGRPRRFASGLRHEPVIYPQTVVALDSVLTCPLMRATGYGADARGRLPVLLRVHLLRQDPEAAGR
jgi:hypothetical protein